MLDNNWEEVAVKTVFDLVESLKKAKYVAVVAEGGYTTSLPIEDLLDEDVLLAYGLNNRLWSQDLGKTLCQSSQEHC